MNFRNATVLTLTTAAIALPGLSFANEMWHPTNGEVGFTYHPEHFQGTKTRAEVRAEAEAARKDGTLVLIERALPLPVKAGEPAKTREQVIDEMRNESPDERRARMDLNRGG